MSTLKNSLVKKYFYSLEEFIYDYTLYEIKSNDVYVRTAF